MDLSGMRTVTLLYRDSNKTGVEVEIPNFNLNPGVIIYKDRVFKLLQADIYEETICFVIEE